MKYNTWKEKKKPFSLPACTGPRYKVTVFMVFQEGAEALVCIHIVSSFKNED